MENNDNIRPGDVSTPPDNYLVWAILSTVLCCLPLGIFSIIKSTEVNKKWAEGDYTGAAASAAEAKKFATWAAIAGVIGIIIYVILVMVLGLGGAILGNSGY